MPPRAPTSKSRTRSATRASRAAGRCPAPISTFSSDIPCGLWLARATHAEEGDVALRVRHRWALPDPADRAGLALAAADHDRLGAALGGDEEVACCDARRFELGGRQPQD